MEKLRIMLDIETLGTRPGCKILSIGATTFSLDFSDRVKSNTAFYTTIRRDDNRFLTDPNTLIWWEQQSYAAMHAAFKGGLIYKSALKKFNSWVQDQVDSINYDEVEFWCKGPHFDISILECAYRIVGLPTPWEYYAIRDLRTAINLFPNLQLPEHKGIKHHALDDALYEAEVAATILRYLDDPIRFCNSAKVIHESPRTDSTEDTI